jgi:hypothetical protein
MANTKSFKFKDKRIDRIIEKKGYSIADCEIFYSPIKVSLTHILILLLASFPYSFYVFVFPIYSLVYIVVAYLFIAHFNNSFILTNEQLIVINPNFPFQKIKTFDLLAINIIIIDNSHINKIMWILGLIHCNYIAVIIEEKKVRFYCEGLELTDDYNEHGNVTEKTLDDFNYALKEHNVLTECVL